MYCRDIQNIPLVNLFTLLVLEASVLHQFYFTRAKSSIFLRIFIPDEENAMKPTEIGHLEHSFLSLVPCPERYMSIHISPSSSLPFWLYNSANMLIWHI